MRKPNAERKREIVETALVLADQKGVGMLSTTHIAAEIGVSQPAIFRHFPTKSDLWENVAKSLVAEMTERWRVVLRSSQQARQMARDLARTQLEFIVLRPAVLDIVFSRQLHHENPEIKHMFQGLMARLVGHFDKLLKSLHPDEPPQFHRDAALILIGTVQSTALRWSLNDKRFDLVDEGMRLIERQLNERSA